MMIDAVMYGMIPRAKMANCVSAPPENRFRKPSDALGSRLLCSVLDRLVGRRPAPGCARPSRYSAIMSSVNRILFRRSGTLNMFFRLVSNAAAPSGPELVRPSRPEARSAVGELVALGRRTAVARTAAASVSTVPPAAVMAASADFEKPCAFTVTARLISPRPSTLTRAPLWARPRSWSDLGRRPRSRPVLVEHVEVDGLVLDPERVVEALQLRDPLLQRHLAALEAARRPCCGPAGPWCRGRRSCRPCRRCRDRPACGRGASRAPASARRLSWRHFSVTSPGDGLDRDEVGDPGDHPADLGTVGQGVRLADAPQAERAQRAAVLRLVADART